MLDQSIEIVGEAFTEPQVVAHVGFFEIERLHSGGAQPFHVPGVEELVRDGAENALPLPRVPQKPVVSDVLLRCSMPSPLAHGRRGSGTCRCWSRSSAARRRSGLFRNDTFDVLAKASASASSVVRQRDANVGGGPFASPIVHRERPQHEVAEVGRAVHQVVEVGRGEDQRIGGREELRPHLHFLPGGCTNVTGAGRSSQPRANISAAAR